MCGEFSATVLSIGHCHNDRTHVQGKERDDGASPSINRGSAKKNHSRYNAIMDAGRIDQLTEAQRDCLRLVLSHHNSKEIAAIVGVSPSAVDKRIERALQVLGATTRFEAARFLNGYENGLADQRDDHRKSNRSADLIEPMYDRLPSEPSDLSTAAPERTHGDTVEPWGLVCRFLGLGTQGGADGMARNRTSRGDRLMRLVAITALIAVTLMASVNLTMTLNGLLKEFRTADVPPQQVAQVTRTGGRN